MKLKTWIMGLVAVIFFAGVYYWTVVLEQKKELEQANLSKIIYLQKDQINYLEIRNKNKKFIFSKNEKGWAILEPVVDEADSLRINDILEKLVSDAATAVVKDAGENATEIRWADFGLDNPDSTIILKNNLGQSQKIFISETKNYEGQNYARIDNNNKILVVQSLWHSFTLEPLVFYREKKLFRGNLAEIKKVNVQSLNDKFSIVKQDNNWMASDKIDYPLDQTKVRQMLKDVAESVIQDYVLEGDPSESEKKEKGLSKDAVLVSFETESESWSVKVGLSTVDKALYALTDKPTYFVRLAPVQWELFGNLSLDSLRDRKTIMTFDVSQVRKFFIKIDNKKVDVEKKPEAGWVGVEQSVSPVALENLLNQVHDLEITYFLSEPQGQAFTGQNMIILKSDEDKLLFQLNWGPLIKHTVGGVAKDVYLARTQASDSIFALSKELVDSWSIDKLTSETKKEGHDDKN